MSEERYMPTYFDLNGRRLDAIATCGHWAMIAYMELLRLGAWRREGWDGSRRGLRISIRARYGTGPGSDAMKKAELNLLSLGLASKKGRGNYGIYHITRPSDCTCTGSPHRDTGTTQVQSEPAQVQSEPAQVQSEPAQVQSEPAQVQSEPVQVHPSRSLNSEVPSPSRQEGEGEGTRPPASELTPAGSLAGAPPKASTAAEAMEAIEALGIRPPPSGGRVPLSDGYSGHVAAVLRLARARHVSPAHVAAVARQRFSCRLAELTEEQSAELGAEWSSEPESASEPRGLLALPAPVSPRGEMVRPEQLPSVLQELIAVAESQSVGQAALRATVRNRYHCDLDHLSAEQAAELARLFAHKPGPEPGSPLSEELIRSREDSR